MSPVPFLPDYPDQVKAIAMAGLTDDEMALALGISEDLIQSWKSYYPSFAKAIDEGRTLADAKVVQALFDNATGFEYEEDVVTREGDIMSMKRRKLPETQAQKFWLENRSDRWRQSQKHQHAVGGHPGLPPIGVNPETKDDVINSILNMIAPRPDNPDE